MPVFFFYSKSSLIVVLICLSTFHSFNTILSIFHSVGLYLLSTPPPLLFPVGQQSSSSLVSIIIIQSALLSTRNCQPSTNTGLAIMKSPLSFCFTCFCFSFHIPFLVFCCPSQFPILLVHILPHHPLFFLFPALSFTLGPILDFGVCFSPLFSKWFAPNQRSDGREKKRKGKGGSVHNWLFKV